MHSVIRSRRQGATAKGAPTGTPATAKRKRGAKPPEEHRKDILDAAAEVFARKGIADARIEDITTLAEVSKGTFYLCFSRAYVRQGRRIRQ
ncbi:TetR/AcrR family transcriptional regulator [Streptomyces sp. cg40]|uniref:TetR/AcrR family transcriptional regulator n=1 Tax=Streptomyces sp. cg40 TaxID=3419764 RepID=UPI003D0701EE